MNACGENGGARDVRHQAGESPPPPSLHANPSSMLSAWSVASFPSLTEEERWHTQQMGMRIDGCAEPPGSYGYTAVASASALIRREHSQYREAGREQSVSTRAVLLTPLPRK